MSPRQPKSRAASPAPDRAPRTPAARSPLQVLADGGPQARRLGRLQASADHSPTVVAQARARDEIGVSPQQAVQLRVVQQAGIEEEEPMQGRFPVQRAAEAGELEEEEPMQGRFPVQREAEGSELEEEEPMQGRFPVQRAAEEEELLQGRGLQLQEAAAAPNRTGMPESLKGGIESLSGMDMSDVRVHANSAKPAEVGALAYAQGSDIHLGPGQEKHLPHEAWHVVQQREGRVQPTTSVAGVAVNDDPALESEADAMGSRAAAGKAPDSRAADR